MADVTVAQPDVDAESGSGGEPPEVDERLAHRGPFQRLLIQPEIGAVEIGSGNIAYGSISLLAPTVVIELSRE